jgi:tRNA (guanine-N7-)-methyltransferase
MGRRALRKIDERIDLSAHFHEPAELPESFDAGGLFARPAPLELEVGSGKGLFLKNASGARPEHNFLGVEISRKYARFAAAALARAGRTNAVLLRADATRLAGAMPDASCAAIHVYFPDPWWKARHKKRRVMTEQFVRELERLLVPGGPLHFWTDVEEYFRGTLELIAAHTTLAGPMFPAEKTPEHDLDFRTHFERRMRLHDEPVYRAEFRRE